MLSEWDVTRCIGRAERCETYQMTPGWRKYIIAELFMMKVQVTFSNFVR